MRRLLVVLLLSACALPLAARVRAVHAPRRILWIGAHPDDEILLSPLLGRECLERGATCAFVVMTRGEAGAPAAVRTAEMQRAADFFHASLTQHDFADVMADVDAVWSAQAGSHDRLVAQIAADIAAAAPTIVYTFDPRHGSTCHPAHRAVGALVAEALAGLAAQPPLILLETAAKFEGDDFDFRSAVACASAVDASPGWSYLIADAQIHATQFSAAQVSHLAATPPAQRRVWLIDRATCTAPVTVTCSDHD